MTRHDLKHGLKRLPDETQVSGAALWRALGYANERAFQRACEAKRVPVHLYPLAGVRKGFYAKYGELLAYLASERRAEKGGMPVER